MPGLIDSGKRAIITLVVEIPAGMKDHEIPMWCIQNIMYSIHFSKLVQNIDIKAGTITPTAPTLVKQ